MQSPNETFEQVWSWVRSGRGLRACFENAIHAARRLSMRRIMQIRIIDSL